MEVENMINDYELKKKNSIKGVGFYNIVIPLIDALKWKGSTHRLNESLARSDEFFSIDNMVETMTNLKFLHYDLGIIKGEKINGNYLPLIVEKVDYGMIVLKIVEDKALIFDGSDGTYKQIDLSKINGRGHFFLSSTDSYEGKDKNWFTKLVYRFKKSLIQISLLTLLMTLLDLAIPGFVVIIYGQVAKAENIKILIMIGFGISVYVGASLILGYLRSKITDYISARMGSIISLETYTRLLYLSPNYTETASVSSQINRIKDFENLKRFVTSGIFLNSIDLIFSLIYLIVIFLLGGWLVYVPLITFIIIIVMGIMLRPIHKLKSESLSEKANQKQQILIEILKNAETIRMSNAKNNWIKKYKKLNADHIYSKFQLADYVNLTNSISYFVCNASVLVFIYGGVLRVFDKSMTMGALIGLLMLYWKVIASIRGSFSLFVQVNGLVKSINQINRFMNLPQDSQVDDGKKPAKPMKGNIIFKDISIRYSQSSSSALSAINLQVNSKDIFGIYGHDGSGKTTILKLILGMYKPQIGRILIDGVNIRQLEPLSLRQSISYSPEYSTLISGKLRDNFIFYNPSISDNEIEYLMDKTGLKSYMDNWGITLDTILSERAISELPQTLKKLFSITRMLCRDVKLYLLDEPENYLSKSEIEKVMNVIKEKSIHENATFVITTKSEEVLSYCSKLIQIDNGKLVSNNKKVV